MSVHKSEDGTPDWNTSPKKYDSRDQLESDILFDLGMDVEIEGRWNGKNLVRVPRWSAQDAEELELALYETIAALFPNDIFVLANINPSNIQSMANEMIRITDKIRPSIKQVVVHTLRISDEDYGRFFRSITPFDLLALWGTIVYQEVTNPKMQAMIKKAVALLVEKFRLEDVWQQFQESMVGPLTEYYRTVPENNSPSGIPMPPSTSSAN